MLEMKPDGVSDDIFNDLVNALDKAIMLIYDMSIRKVAFPGDMIRRWENLVKYARAKESEVEQDEVEVIGNIYDNPELLKEERYSTAHNCCNVIVIVGHYAICPSKGRRPDCPLKLVEDKEVEP